VSAENLHGEGSAAAAEVRTGPRHAAPKKPLFNRFHMPAGKAIAMAAMPTAVLMGIGFTPTLALADDAPTAKSLTADEYKDCIAALDGASPSASASPSSSPDDSATATPSPSASSGSGSDSGSNSGGSSSDSGSDDKATPTPSPSASASKEESNSSSENSGSATATPSPSASASDDGNLLTEIGDAITGIFTGGSGDASSASPTPTPSASASKSADDSAGDTAKETTEKVTDTVKDTVKDTTDTASKAAEDTTKAVEDATKAAEAAADATASPSPSASSTTDPEDCPVATDDVGDTEPGVTVADNAWTLKASSLLLKGADYQGVVKVKTASGKTKKVLKYVISGGTDIGDLHQIVTERGKTYHVQAGKGTTSTITDGKTIMYTESISGNLLGLIPITFSPDSPPPLNIPIIYFTNVTVQQAAQYGGTLTVPGMRQYSES
jgi:hypothetical protein